MVSGDFALTIRVETSNETLFLKRDEPLLEFAEEAAVAFGQKGIFEPDAHDRALTHYYPPHTIREIAIRDKTIGPRDTKVTLRKGRKRR
jgi:hypothetical protein